MRILFTVCARAGSKGINGKNFRKFLGYPLLFYTFSVIDLYVKKHPEKTVDIAFNTDSTEMADMVRTLKIDVTHIPRKAEHATDVAAKIDAIADTWQSMEQITGNVYDMVVDCDVTSPLRTVADIDHLVEKMQGGKWDVVFSVTKARRNPYFNMVKVFEDGHAERVIPTDITARQQTPSMYDMNASLYAYCPEFLAKGKPLMDGRCGVVMMPDTGVLDLDDEEDFDLMEAVAGQLLSRNGEIKKMCENIDDLISQTSQLLNPRSILEKNF